MSGGAQAVHLRILYLMGGRMDRAMPESEGRQHPFTLAVVCDALKSVHWDSISIFDPHSDVSPALLRAKVTSPADQVLQAMTEISPANPQAVLIVSPDAGAAKRIESIAHRLGNPTVTQCVKQRDEATGKLKGFRLLDPDIYADRDCLIVDDLCDGGWTFTSIAGLMVTAGAQTISLYVSHGVFSKGFELANVGRVFTTDSYCSAPAPPPHVTIRRLG